MEITSTLEVMRTSLRSVKKNAPFAVEEYIVILTSSHLFRIGQKNVYKFSPSMAIHSHNFIEKNHINVHYDYTVE